MAIAKEYSAINGFLLHDHLQHTIL